MAYALDYIDVAQRIADFRAKHPEGSLQPADLTKPYSIQEIGGQVYIVVVAAAYRTPDDPRPGIGMAYEIFPGKTNFTRGSELQNAETSAWGRAIVAAMAGDTKKGIASAEEVRNRREEQQSPEQDDPQAAGIFGKLLAELKAAQNDHDLAEVSRAISPNASRLSKQQLAALQQAWKDRNMRLKVSSVEAEIEKVETQDDYDRVSKMIDESKFDPDTKADLVTLIDETLMKKIKAE